jgi:hypothetical protein
MKNPKVKVGDYVRLTRHNYDNHDSFYGHHVGDVGVVERVDNMGNPEVVVPGRKSTSTVASEHGNNAVCWNGLTEFEVFTPDQAEIQRRTHPQFQYTTTSTDDPIPVNEDLVREQTSLADDIFARLRSQYIL